MNRILAVHPSDELYGADRVLLQSVEVLERRGRVRVWLPSDIAYASRLLSRELAARRIHVSRHDLAVLRREYARPRGIPGLVARSWRTLRDLARDRPTLVYVNTSAMLPVAPLARLVGARVVVHVHEAWTRTEQVLLAPLLWCCHRVVAVSEAVVRPLPVSRTKVTVVHNGVDAAEPAVGDRAALRESLGVRESDTLVLVASRWNRWKGLDVLLDAWSRLERDDLHLVVLGGPPPSGPAVDVEGIVAAMPSGGSVSVVGEVEDASAWFAASDVVVVPSIAPDPFPLVAVEAAAHGVAVFASRIGGLPEMVVDGVTGELVEPGDADAWARALAASDRTSLDLAGSRAAARHREGFTHSAYAQRLDAALREAVEA